MSSYQAFSVYAVLVMASWSVYWSIKQMLRGRRDERDLAIEAAKETVAAIQVLKEQTVPPPRHDLKHALITGPVTGIVTTASGKHVDALETNALTNRMEEAVAHSILRPPESCIEGGQHEETSVILPNGDVVNHLCTKCYAELVPAGRGWRTKTPDPST